jgi:hypothetical protein
MLKRRAYDLHVVQFFRRRCLRRCERSYVDDAEHINLGLNFLLIEGMRDFVPQLICGLQNFPNLRIYLCRVQSLTEFYLFGELKSFIFIAGYLQEIIHELLNGQMVVEHDHFYIVALFGSLHGLLMGFIETWIVAFQGVPPPHRSDPDCGSTIGFVLHRLLPTVEGGIDGFDSIMDGSASSLGSGEAFRPRLLLSVGSANRAAGWTSAPL